MARRVFISEVQIGEIHLPQNESHHLRDVLRVENGQPIELFDAGGNVGLARVVNVSSAGVTVHIDQIHRATTTLNLIVASAVPKGDRADWMVEKLSELGVARWVPLQTARSVVHPEGKNKFERWSRIATEAAKQSHRSGVLEIAELTQLVDLMKAGNTFVYLSPRAADSLVKILGKRTSASGLTLLIGPEGGWSEEELKLFVDREIEAACLGSTILRVETAAIAAAAVAQMVSAE